MKKMDISKYFKVYCSATGLMLLCAVLVNLLVDPYDLFGIMSLDGFNARKTEVSSHIRLSKAKAVKKIKPRSIILGSSRAEVGLDPDHLGWKHKPVYNLGLSGTNIYETMRYFQHAYAVNRLNQVVLSVDFFMFNAYQKNQPDFDEMRMVATPDGKVNVNVKNEAIPVLLSIDSLIASYNTVRKQEQKNAVSKNNGQLEPEKIFNDVVMNGGHRKAFLKNERFYTKKNYFPDRDNRFSFNDKTNANSTMEHFRLIAKTSYQKGIDLRILISPCHARQLEVIAAVGLWSRFEEWKKYLVRINEEEALTSGRKSFPVWDFSGYNSYTMEKVPQLGDNTTQMDWYVESSHYNKDLGDLVLSEVLNDAEENSDNVYIGVKLTMDNIDRHMAKLRNDRIKYRKSNPEDIVEIEIIAKKAGRLL